MECAIMKNVCRSGNLVVRSYLRTFEGIISGSKDDEDNHNYELRLTCISLAQP